MRIFCAVRHANDPNFFYGGLWSGNFYPALRELGHELIESQTDLLPVSRFMDIADGFTREESEVRARTTERILDEVRAAQRQGRVHLFLSYFYNAHFDPAGFDELRRLAIPSVNFYCNSMYQFAQVAAVAAKADFSWHTEREARARYVAAGANPVWIQMGADPKAYHPVEGVVRQSKVCFVGQRYADRDRWAAALVSAGVPLDLYGSGWRGNNAAIGKAAEEAPAIYLGRIRHRPGSPRSYGRAVLDVVRAQGIGRGAERLFRQWRYRSKTRRLTALLSGVAKGRAAEVAETFAAYEVVVNFSNVWADGRPGSQLIPHVRLRDFEAPMCRSCYLTGYSDEIEEFYEIRREIDTYRTPVELIEKTRFYLSHPTAAEKLREGGYRRALRDHIWSRRFEELFQKIGLATK